MKTSTYVGIDYGLGQSNIDRETGIRYGVISQHSITPESWDDSLEPDYGDPHCPKCGNDVADTNDDETREWEHYGRGCHDYVCRTCNHWLASEDCYPEDPISWISNDPDYTIDQCLRSDLFVLKSPYYTHTRFCSPCVPGAGDLDNYCAEGPKTYCLGHDWFEGGTAPYPVFRVSDDAEVIADARNQETE